MRVGREVIGRIVAALADDATRRKLAIALEALRDIRDTDPAGGSGPWWQDEARQALDAIADVDTMEAARG